MRIPGDDTDDLLASLREGRTLTELEGEDPEDVDVGAEPAPADHQAPSASGVPIVAPPTALEVPSVLRRVLASSAAPELLAVAAMLDEVSANRFIVYHTPIGNVRCRINWMSCPPEEVRAEGSHLFLVKMQTEAAVFTPTPGAKFAMGFDDGQPPVDVVCLSEPQQLYPGVDLLVFMSHNPPVEKNGRLNEGAPSVVSGARSDAVVDGEPVLTGEQPLSETITKAAMRREVRRDFDPARRDLPLEFDTTRES